MRRHRAQLLLHRLVIGGGRVVEQDGDRLVGGDRVRDEAHLLAAAEGLAAGFVAGAALAAVFAAGAAFAGGFRAETAVAGTAFAAESLRPGSVFVAVGEFGAAVVAIGAPSLALAAFEIATA